MDDNDDIHILIHSSDLGPWHNNELGPWHSSELGPWHSSELGSWRSSDLDGHIRWLVGLNFSW